MLDGPPRYGGLRSVVPGLLAVEGVERVRRGLVERHGASRLARAHELRLAGYRRNGHLAAQQWSPNRWLPRRPTTAVCGVPGLVCPRKALRAFVTSLEILNRCHVEQGVRQNQAFGGSFTQVRKHAPVHFSSLTEIAAQDVDTAESNQAIGL